MNYKAVLSVLLGLGLGIVCGILLSGCGKGRDGNVGAQGPQGNVPFYMVQLCPGTTIYPSKFIEVAFCVNGVLYGTYSANGGFSTELPPGSYGSNGINASCNFVISDNCIVTNSL